MGANVNTVVISGNLTRDPELRFTQTGTAHCKFTIANNREWLDKNKDRKKDTIFIDIIVWGKTAEFVAQRLHKGSPVFVTGRLSVNSWETTEGQKRKSFEIVAEQVTFLDPSDHKDNPSVETPA